MSISKAAELADQGRWHEARAAVGAALDGRDGDLESMADAADFLVGNAADSDADREWLEDGIRLARRAAKLARRSGSDELATEMELLEANASNQLGLSEQALAVADRVLARRPDDLDALFERGFALFELCRFDEARQPLERALRLAADDAAVNHVLGLIAERTGRTADAARHFRAATRSDPIAYPEPVHIPAREFDDAIEAALADLPDGIRRWLSNVAITVEDLPGDDDLRGSDPPLSPCMLGVFRGSPLGDKASMDPWSHFPSSIVLYQRNLERAVRTREELIEEIGVTLVHEVGHFLGLDEQDLWERGLD